MSPRDPSSSPQVHVVLDEDQRRRRVRELWFAVGVCDVLLVAIVLIGLAAEWPWWSVVLAALVPLVIGAFAMRAAIVLGRSGARTGSAAP